MTQHNNDRQFKLIRIITLALLAYVVGSEIIKQIP